MKHYEHRCTTISLALITFCKTHGQIAFQHVTKLIIV